MADTKISALPAASTPLAGTEVLPIVQSGTTKQVSVANLTAGRAVSVASLTATGTIQGAIVNAISGTGDQLLINAKTNDATAANNAGVGLRANSSATAASRFAQLWFDADGANLSGGDYFLLQKNGNSGTVDLIQYSNSAMRFAANYIGRGQIDLTIGTTGDVTFNTGNLIQGTAAKGVNFTANTPAAGMTSQLLNWYEEGTWTPVVEGGTTPGTATYTTQVGRYTRIGNMVTLNCSLGWSAHTGSGVMIVTGLPFTAATVLGLQWVGTIYASNLDFGTNATAFVSLISSAGTTMTFRGLVNNAARTNPALDTSVDALVISITYQVA